MTENWKQDVWKVIAVVCGACAVMAANRDLLPAALKPYHEWIELVAFLWTTVHAVRITPPQKKEPES